MIKKLKFSWFEFDSIVELSYHSIRYYNDTLWNMTMSTKCSLYYCENFHLYRESFDEKSIYLKINNEKIKINIEFSLQDFAKISACFNFEALKKQSEITDEDIKNYVKNVIKLRDTDGIGSLFGIGVYGSTLLPKETQIENGINFFKEKRNSIKLLLEQMENKKTYDIPFGLEDIIYENSKVVKI